ncbi:hypothetical protein PTKIN_Ptkin02bG0235500 [Pterospermum kingtungense]
MDDIQINGGADEEVIGDDFYEKIEAPKFVDLTAPDRCRTDTDDRYWFCLRVGCDQKHEAEMDSEAIYKNFVLRVMAARSPSVRLRKASSILQCPKTVPAKPSKSRVSKLAMISSISQKMGEPKVKVRPVSKQSATATATPNVKAAKGSSAKALTTPRNKKGISNPGTFRSVRNPKPTTTEVPKTRVVSKALVFQSPKKAVKLKKSVELSSSSLRKICAGMKKLEISEKNTLRPSKPLDGARKQLRGREVKSRVFDSLNSQNQKKKQEAKPSKCLKKKNKEKDLQLTKGPMCRKPNEKASTEIGVEAKSEDGSLEVCSTSGVSKSPSKSLDHEGDQKVKFSSDDDASRNSGDNDVPKCIEEENIEPCSKDKEIPEATQSDDNDKENAMASHIKVSESKVVEIDDKENASASDGNRKLNCTAAKLVKKDVLVKHEASKSIQKVTNVTSNTLKENSTYAVNGTQRKKSRKPKVTNPKPFRLRTDERGILKEANLEKKHLQAPVKETTFPGPHGGNSRRKHQNVQRNEKCLGQTETGTCTHERSDKESDTRTLKDQPKRAAPTHQKTKTPSLLEKGQDKAAQRCESRLEKTKSPSMKQLARPRGGVASNRKKLVSLIKPGQLGATKETPPNKRETSLATKASASNASKASPQRRSFSAAATSSAANPGSLAEFPASETA